MVDRLTERIRGIIHNQNKEQSFLPPEAIGSALVKTVEPNPGPPGKDAIALDIPKDDEGEDFYVLGVPHNQFKPGDRVEVIIRRKKLPKPKSPAGTSFFERAASGYYQSPAIEFETAVRPYDPKTVGQFTKVDGVQLPDIFRQNSMDLNDHSGFTQRFRSRLK